VRNTNAAATAGQFHPEFNVVLAYDEHAGGIRAKEFFDTLALATFEATLRQLGESVNVQVVCQGIDWPAMDSHFARQITKPQLREEPRRHAPLPGPWAGQPGWGLNE